ncbi:hypothetical protein MRB53_041217 [Persea americana]|nr:hypothetical protein MRB53_041217 [Persea americana]
MRKSVNYVLSYSQAIDIWSMGGVVVALYTNELPSSVQHGTSNSADSTKQINFSSPVWRRVSAKGKAYISETMAIDEHKRINADQALQHAWFHDQKYAADLQRAYKKVIQDWKSQRDGSSQG